MNVRSNRLYAALGIAFVVTSFASVALGSGLDNGPGISASDAKWAAAIAHPIATHNWIAAYLAMLSVGCFVAFAVWAVGRLGDGVLAQVARVTAAVYAAIIAVSLGAMNTYGYLEGHGLTVSTARALDELNTATFVGSWFVTAFFLLAVGALALTAARRALGWSAIGIGVVTLVAIPSIENFGQLSVMLFFAWVLAASVALARGPARQPAVAAPQHA